MFDCFFAVDRPKPRLDGLLPCILEGLSREPLPDSIEACVARSAGGDRIGVDAVRRWLEYGPPLLLIVDLNAVASEYRPSIAKMLIDFLSQNAGHRAVVTYRSHADDDTLNQLRRATWDERRTGERDRIFVRAGLEPMDTQAAFLYLKNVRWVESKLARGQDPDEAAIQADIAIARELIDRFDRGEGSLVSIPLLLYFVGTVGAERVKDARSAAGLYHVVVKEFLEREQKAFAAANPSPGKGPVFDRDLVSAAMSRLALAILSHGAGTVQISGGLAAKENLNLLMMEPANCLADFLPPDDPEWIDQHWRSSPSVNRPLPPLFEEGEARGIGERSFLRWSSGAVRFLHDSFVYYFAALALRCPGHLKLAALTNRIDATWRKDLIRWWQTDPTRWKETAEFLGGMLSADQARELACNMVVARSKAGWPALVDRVVGNHVPGEDATLNALDFTLHHKEGMLDRAPSALFAEVYHYFRDGSGNESLVGKAEELRARHREPWLRSDPAASPTTWPQPSMHRHRDWVSCVALLPDGRVVSAGPDGQVILWDPQRRTTRVLYQHESWVECLAVSGDGQVVVSGGLDRVVALHGCESGRDAAFLAHAFVWELAMAREARLVVAGLANGQVLHLWIENMPAFH
jgi:hypothetical protein